MDLNDVPRAPGRRIDDAGPVATQRRISLENRMDALEEKLDKNTELTEKIVSLFGTMEAGMKFLGLLGAVLKWAVTFASAGAALWAIIQGKGIPK